MIIIRLGSAGYFSAMIMDRVFIAVLFFASLVFGQAGCDDSPIQPVSVSLAASVRSRPWSQLPSGQELTTRHYRIYTTVQSHQLLTTLPGFMEAAYENYLDLTGLTAVGADSTMAVYLLETRNQWAQLSDFRFGQNSMPSVVVENGGYMHEGVTVCWNIGGMATYAVLAHEGMHQFLYYRLRNRLPLWADEGLATLSEGFVFDGAMVRFMPRQNIARLSSLREALSSQRHLPLEKLLTATPREYLTMGVNGSTYYYGQVWALMNFILASETYRPRWQVMLTDAAAGHFNRVLAKSELQLRGWPYTKAVSLPLFRHYIEQDIQAFNTAYLQYCRKLARLE